MSLLQIANEERTGGDDDGEPVAEAGQVVPFIFTGTRSVLLFFLAIRIFFCSICLKNMKVMLKMVQRRARTRQVPRRVPHRSDARHRWDETGERREEETRGGGGSGTWEIGRKLKFFSISNCWPFLQAFFYDFWVVIFDVFFLDESLNEITKLQVVDDLNRTAMSGSPPHYHCQRFIETFSFMQINLHLWFSRIVGVWNIKVRRMSCLSSSVLSVFGIFHVPGTLLLHHSFNNPLFDISDDLNSFLPFFVISLS